MRRFVLFNHVYERKTGDKVFSYYQINAMGKTIFELVEDVERYIASKAG